LKGNAWLLEHIIKDKIKKYNFELEDLLPSNLVIEFAKEFFERDGGIEFDESKIEHMPIIDYIVIEASMVHN